MENSIQFMDAYTEEGYMYFSAANFNGLFRLKKGSSEAEFLGYFTGEPLWQVDLHRQVIGVGDKLYFLPFNGSGISIYEKRTGDFSFVKIDTIQQVLVSRAFVIKDDIIMICSNLKEPFIIFHTEKNAYEFADDLRDSVKEKLSASEKIFFNLYGSCMVDEKIYLTVQNTNKVLAVNLLDRKVNIYSLPGKYKLRNIYIDKGIFYFTQSGEGAVVRWDFRTNDCYEYSLREISGVDDYAYITLLRWEGKLLLLPGQADNILELDEEKDEWCVKADYIPKDFFRIKKGKTLFAGYQDMDETLFLFPRRGNGMLCLFKGKCELYKVQCIDEIAQEVKKIREQHIKERMFQGDILHEGDREENSLNYMLPALVNDPGKRKIKNAMNMGKKIWDYCS